mmetsp:Transcript_26235/g.62356  ORF Transcript_26235/g.62356 Transcript_26235/m.62356 type:complete len:84 (+) Transcript_26235:2221-2472(+)
MLTKKESSMVRASKDRSCIEIIYIIYMFTHFTVDIVTVLASATMLQYSKCLANIHDLTLSRKPSQRLNLVSGITEARTNAAKD